MPVDAGNVNIQAPPVNHWAEFVGNDVPAPVPAHLWYDDPAQVHNPFEQEAQQALFKEQVEYNMKAKIYKGYVEGAKEARSTSLPSDEFRDLAKLLTDTAASFRQEQEELANVLEVIATKVEVVRDIGSTVQSRISILQMVANRLETLRQSLLPQGSLATGLGLSASHSVPEQAPQPVGAGVAQVAPGLWQQGQG